jgi:hypothetical protein
MNIVTTELPDGYLGVNYSDTIEARGGTLPYTFTVQSGQLPHGLALDGSTGVISGMPDSIAEYGFTILCTDSSAPQKTDTQIFAIAISPQTGIEDEIERPSEFELLGNYPNPFNSSTVIRLQMPSAGHVRIDLFNVIGQHMQTLYDGVMNAGRNEIVWNGKSASSGVYFYRVASGGRVATQKMTLLK